MVKTNKNLKGFSLLEVVVALGILAVLGGTLVPMVSRVDISEKVLKTRRKLEVIKAALEDYFYEKMAFPSSATNDLTDSNFLKKYLSEDTNNQSIRDDFSTSNSYYQYTYSGTPPVAYVWSVGPDETDNTHTGDDIWIEADSEIPARKRTRNKLNIIGRAYAKYLKTHAIPSTAWTTTSRALIGLGTEFDKDGFGNNFVNVGSTTISLYSLGPDGAVNTGTTVNLVGTGDDMRH